jgi:hypothetical protein
MKAGERITVAIGNRVVPCYLVVDADSDPSCALWVAEVDNSDQDHFITLDQIL